MGRCRLWIFGPKTTVLMDLDFGGSGPEMLMSFNLFYDHRVTHSFGDPGLGNQFGKFCKATRTMGSIPGVI